MGGDVGNTVPVLVHGQDHVGAAATVANVLGRSCWGIFLMLDGEQGIILEEFPVSWGWCWSP